ncbi:hypothetical protein TWF694_008574 [Orbilia ellipsospora]|uniref:Ubiquitin-protein ligase sel1 n=1 Tax=Orbilia ellipsospora TaxID=2528407 RepID=A0AAV9XJX7_9PEZI
MAPIRTLLRRQSDLFIDGGYGYGWWYSETAIIVKWSIGAALFVFILVYFVGGYLHAKRRLAKGLPPLAYHRWMIKREITPPDAYAYPIHFNGNNGGYGNYGGYAEPFQPPPPVYNPLMQPPPSYYPDNMPHGARGIPMNATKTNPDQNLPGQQPGPGGEASGSGPRP